LIGASAYVAYLPAQSRLIIRYVMPIATLAGWLIASRNERVQKYQELSAGFFSVSLGLLLTSFVDVFPNKWLDLPPITIKGMAVAKFSNSLPIILTMPDFPFEISSLLGIAAKLMGFLLVLWWVHRLEGKIRLKEELISPTLNKSN